MNEPTTLQQTTTATTRKKHDENEIRIKLCGSKDDTAGGGRGEINKAASFRLGSDGSTENSDSDSNTRDSPSPPYRSVIAYKYKCG